jgi:hypothetical protein
MQHFSDYLLASERAELRASRERACGGLRQSARSQRGLSKTNLNAAGLAAPAAQLLKS